MLYRSLTCLNDHHTQINMNLSILVLFLAGWECEATGSLQHAQAGRGYALPYSHPSYLRRPQRQERNMGKCLIYATILYWPDELSFSQDLETRVQNWQL